jgi:cell division septum initiation protein DivIVA
MGCLTKAKRVELMSRFYRFLAILVFVARVGSVSMLHAQESAEVPAAAPPQATDTPAVQQAPDSDLVTEVQQLRAELDQLKNQMAQVNSILEQLQANQAPKVATPPRTKRTPPAASKKTTAAATATTTPPVAVEPDEVTPTTVLVFHDGHRIEARNYAIVGQSLWIYTADDSKKVPLADLDVAATKTANSDRGVVFQLPPTK